MDSSAETPEAAIESMTLGLPDPSKDSPSAGAEQGAGEGGEAADDTPPSSAAHAPDEAEQADEPKPDETAEQKAARERDEAGRFAKSKRKDPQARIDAITYEREEAKRQAQAEKTRADQLAAELDALRRGDMPQQGAAASSRETTAPGPAATSTKPELAAYDSYEEYVEALADWKTDQKLAAYRAELEERNAHQSRLARVSEYNAKVKAFAETVPDFAEVMANAHTVPVSAVMQDVLLSHPRAAELTYFLATHPEEAARLANQSVNYDSSTAPLMRELLDAKLAPSAATTSGAATGAPRTPVPRPITPVGSSAVQAEPDPTEMEFGPEYVRRMNALEAKKRARS